jgi:hypothetical protein
VRGDWRSHVGGGRRSREWGQLAEYSIPEDFRPDWVIQVFAMP